MLININKSANFRFYHIGLFGLPLPLHPIHAESPHSRCEHSLYFGMKFSNLWKIEWLLNKANAYLYMLFVWCFMP